MESSSAPVEFPLLAFPKVYEPATIPLRSPADDGSVTTAAEKKWIDVFRRSIPSFRKRAEQDDSVEDAATRAQKFEERYSQILDDFESDPNSHSGPPTIMLMCRLRDTVLREVGFLDIFKKVKEEENEKALKLLPSVLRSADAIADDAQRLQHLLRGVLAGNIFDLGVAKYAEDFEKGGLQFEETLGKLLERPWVLDDMDAFTQAWLKSYWKKVVIFVDNAGADLVLGILPLAREMVRHGVQVILAANDMPTINDITASELLDVLQKVQDTMEDDEELQLGVDRGLLVVVNSGSDLPVIDLSSISPELAFTSEDAELVILEGMGRSIETNLRAKFKCSSLNIGMVKHQEVADFLGGRLYDCVVKFSHVLPELPPPTPSKVKGKQLVSISS